MEEKIQEEQLVKEKKRICFPCCPCSWWQMLICVVVGLLIIGGAVYAGYQLGRKSLSQRELLVPPEPIATQGPINQVPTSVEVSPTPSITSRWKTFRNAEYNYSLEYPADWQLETVDFGVIINSSKNLTTKELKTFGVTYSSSSHPVARISIAVRLETKPINMAHLRERVGSSDTFELTRSLETKFQGYPAIKYWGKGIGIEMNEYSSIIVGVNSVSYQISLQNYLNDSQNQKILNQILSTFRFVD